MKRRNRELERLEGGQGSVSSKDKVFVGGIDYTLNEDDFRRHFSQYGEVKDVQIVRDVVTGASRGFGFVTFYDENVARRLITEVQICTMAGRKVDLRTADPKSSERVASIN